MLAHMRAPATPHVASTTPRIHRAGAQTRTIISVLPHDQVSEQLPQELRALVAAAPAVDNASSEQLTTQNGRH